MGTLSLILNWIVDFIVFLLFLFGTIIEIFIDLNFGLVVVIAGATIQVIKEILSIYFFKEKFSLKFVFLMLISAVVSFSGIVIIWLLRNSFSERTFIILLLNSSLLSLIVLISILARVVIAIPKRRA